MTNKRFLWTIMIWSILLWTSCSTAVSDENASSVGQIEDSPTTGDTPEVEQEKIYYYAVVDNLRLRKEGNLKSEVVETLREGASLEFTGNQTSFKDKIKLRGEEHNEPWYEVLTEKGNKGWVYGGAVRQLIAADTGVEKEHKARIQKTLSQVKPSKAVIRGDKKYEIELTNGKKITLKDVSVDEAQEDDMEDLDYVGTFPDVNYHLFDMYGYEYWEMILINGKTGKRTSIIGHPVLSPNKKRFGIFHGDLAAGFTANGVQIFRIDGEYLVEEYNEEASFELEPSRLNWKNNQIIEVTLHKLEYGEETEISEVKKVQLTRKEDKWTLK